MVFAYQQPERPTVPCRWCGKPTEMTGTRMCDQHWELHKRVTSEPEMAWRMLAELDNEAAVDVDKA